MNKAELVEAAAEQAGLSRSDVAKAVDATIDTIVDTVRRGEKVTITGFGNFERRERSARTARNPQTGEQMQVPASKAPAFKAGKSFKDRVNS
jgi:DNA-binding protein HU-beta